MKETPAFPRFTTRDWREIYYALDTKESLVRDGLYGKDALARRWEKHLSAIRRKILRAGIEV